VGHGARDRATQDDRALMCGRFNVDSGPLSMLLLELAGVPHPGPDNHNTAPTETVVVVRDDGQGLATAPMRWWLTPYWAKEVATRYSMFNARSESVARSPAFREPLRRRRCVVPISGFYEWQRANARKLPFYITPAQGAGMLLAGVWDRWRNPANDEVLESFAVLTTAAHPTMRFVHDRQPVMLAIHEAHHWLDGAAALEDLERLFEPRLAVALDAIPVSTYVNNARNKEARCIEPIGTAVRLG
jgi:putative SOS response-associated peptidase YedK